jgi:hypothetical protein
MFGVKLLDTWYIIRYETFSVIWHVFKVVFTNYEIISLM